MPEISERAVITNSCRATIGNRILDRIEIPDDSNHSLHNFKELIKRLPLQIKLWDGLGKKMIITLEDESYLVVSFGMTGKMALHPTIHTRMIFYFSHNLLPDLKNANTNLGMDICKIIANYNFEILPVYFNDVRKGYANAGVVYYPTFKQYEECILDRHGIDPLSDDFTLETFRNILSKSRMQIASLLVDPTKINGPGNYIRCEAMYKARVYPFTPANQLTRYQSGNLYRYLKKIIIKSIRLGGHTLKDYVDLNGKKGKFKPRCYGRSISRDKYKYRITAYKKNKNSQTIWYAPNAQVEHP